MRYTELEIDDYLYDRERRRETEPQYATEQDKRRALWLWLLCGVAGWLLAYGIIRAFIAAWGDLALEALKVCGVGIGIGAVACLCLWALVATAKKVWRLF